MSKVFFYCAVFVFSFIIISLWNFYTVIRLDQYTTSFTPADFKLPSETIFILLKQKTK